MCCGDTLATVGIISKVFSYLDRAPKRRADGHLAPDALRGEIVFQNVTFSYPSAAGDEPALKVSLRPDECCCCCCLAGSRTYALRTCPWCWRRER